MDHFSSSKDSDVHFISVQCYINKSICALIGEMIKHAFAKTVIGDRFHKKRPNV